MRRSRSSGRRRRCSASPRTATCWRSTRRPRRAGGIEAEVVSVGKGDGGVVRSRAAHGEDRRSARWASGACLPRPGSAARWACSRTRLPRVHEAGDASHVHPVLVHLRRTRRRRRGGFCSRTTRGRRSSARCAAGPVRARVKTQSRFSRVHRAHRHRRRARAPSGLTSASCSARTCRSRAPTTTRRALARRWRWRASRRRSCAAAG